MKSSKLLLSVLALAAFAAAPVLRAEDTPAPSAPAAGAGDHKGARGGSPEQRLAELTKKLDLTDDQVAKIKPILKDEAEALKALKEDTSVDKEAKRPKMMEIRKSHQDQILAILTPDQQAKLKAMREQHKPSKPTP